MENPVTRLLALARERRDDAFLDELDALDARWFVSLDSRARSLLSGLADPPTGLLSRDGRVRERAARKASPRRGIIALLAIRCTDHVPQVRRAAQKRLRKMPADLLVELLPLVDHLARERERTVELEALLEARMLDDVLRAAGTPAAWRRLIARGAYEGADGLVAARDPALRGVAARALPELPVHVRAATARALVTDRVGWIAALALDALVEIEGDAAVRDALNGRSATVRRRARDWARTRGIDARAAYLERLAAQPDDAIALIGLAEIGDPEDLDRLANALDDARPRIRSAALGAVGRLDPVRAKPAALAALEEGGRPFRAAMTVLRRAPVTEADLARAERTARDLQAPWRARMRALALLRPARWRHLALLLELHAERGGLADQIDVWVQRNFKVARGPEPGLRATIERHLSAVDPEPRRLIEFILRTTS